MRGLRLLTGVTLAVVALALAACGSGSDGQKLNEQDESAVAGALSKAQRLADEVEGLRAALEIQQAAEGELGLSSESISTKIKLTNTENRLRELTIDVLGALGDESPDTKLANGQPVEQFLRRLQRAVVVDKESGRTVDAVIGRLGD